MAGAALDGVYKLAAIRNDAGQWSYRMKLSDTPGKRTRPGLQQVRRFYHGDAAVADLLFDEAAPATAWAGQAGANDREIDLAGYGAHADLLVPVVEAGARVDAREDLAAMRQRALDQFAFFAARPDYPAVVDRYLERSTAALDHWLRHGEDPQPTPAELSATQSNEDAP